MVNHELKRITYYINTWYFWKISGVERNCWNRVESKSVFRSQPLFQEYSFLVFSTSVSNYVSIVFLCQIPCPEHRISGWENSTIPRQDNNNNSSCSYYLIFRSHTKCSIVSNDNIEIGFYDARSIQMFFKWCERWRQLMCLCVYDVEAVVLILYFVCTNEVQAFSTVLLPSFRSQARIYT